MANMPAVRIRSSLVMKLQVADGRPIPFLPPLVPLGSPASRCRTASVFLPERLVLPVSPLFLFKHVPYASNFRTFVLIVLKQELAFQENVP